MRRIIQISSLFIFIVSFALPSLFAQGLERNAERIKNNYPTEYQNTIRQHAIDEWGNEHDMVVYEINKQADALIKLINSFESSNTSIAFSAIKEWSIDGYTSDNIRKFKNLDRFNLENLIEMHCEWDMVKYEYDKQVKAKNSY